MSHEKPLVIALEEHFMEPSLAQYLGKAASPPVYVSDRLYDFFDLRLSEMDSAGVDMQVLSHQSPGSQRLGDDVAVEACRNVNNALADVIAQKPDRFAGFAMIPTNTPDLAADELTRAVEEKGMKGAMIHGMNHGEFLDLRRYWPIFARAEALGVPIYIHPSLPDKTVTERYYAPYDQTHSMMTKAAWGFGIEAGTHTVRLILSGLFQEHPNLKILLGHLGEALPFWLSRIDESFARPGNPPSDFAEVFKRNFWLTTSGFFDDTAFGCTVETMGIDRVLFAVDYPYASSKAGVDWLMQTRLTKEDLAKVASGNAQRLLGL
ncbi:MAG: amidohydrolase family protein [Octadecabacter sp.]|nr:amidohydrolase family protein [Octadecabacter sp.]